LYIPDEGGIPPVPDIKANGSDGPLTIAQQDSLSVTISLVPGTFHGLDADWWVLAASQFGWHHCEENTGAWLPGLVVTHQGALYPPRKPRS